MHNIEMNINHDLGNGWWALVPACKEADTTPCKVVILTAADG
jgi:hypothetical protein